MLKLQGEGEKIKKKAALPHSKFKVEGWGGVFLVRSFVCEAGPGCDSDLPRNPTGSSQILQECASWSSSPAKDLLIKIVFSSHVQHVWTHFV